MKNKAKIVFNISNFEPISENSENKLIGGFSASMTGGADSLDTISNNCMGGNCDTNCGGGQNIKCNSVNGCGVIQE
ncbi:hypothetical protein [Lacinutrix chionoecetis]